MAILERTSSGGFAPKYAVQQLPDGRVKYSDGSVGWPQSIATPPTNTGSRSLNMTPTPKNYQVPSTSPTQTAPMGDYGTASVPFVPSQIGSGTPSAPVKDPMQIYYQNLNDMMKYYQTIGDNTQNYAAKGQLEKEQLGQGFTNLDPNLIGAPASIQNAAVNADMAAVEPDITNINDRIKLNLETVDRFNTTLDMANKFGEQYAKYVPIDENTVNSVKEMISAGVPLNQIPEETLKKALAKISASDQATMFASWRANQEADKTPKSTKSIVKIGGVDYEYDSSTGTYTLPQVPTVPTDPSVIANLQGKISLVDSLLENDSGLGEAVGNYRMSRANPFSNKVNDFVAGVKQLTNQQTLETLINLKRAGGTLGALSDSEGQMLREAGSKINAWEIKDKNGNATGRYKVGETEFRAELQRIKDLTKTALQRATGSSGTGDPLDEALKAAGFSRVDSDTNSAVVNQVASIKDGIKGGQCGRFVNQLTGLGLGDSYQSKISKMDPSIKYPQPGMVFVMPYSNTGHTGIVLAVNNGMATVKDSNYSLNEKIRTHQIPVSLMTGFRAIS